MTDTSIFTCLSAKNEARLKQWDFFFFFSAGCGSLGLGEEGRLEALGEGCLSSLTQCYDQAGLSVHTWPSLGNTDPIASSFQLSECVT